MKRLSIVVMLLLILPVLSSAQTLFTGVNYQMAVPVADTRDFINRIGLVGFGVEVRRYLRPNLSIGFSANWNVLRRRGGSADDFNLRVIKALPILFAAQFYLGNRRTFKPYVGIAAGAYNIHRREESDTGIHTRDDWHFGFVPEVGFVAMTRGYLGVMGAVRYHSILASGDADKVNYVSVSVGVLWAR
jgi:outer membrane protein W